MSGERDLDKLLPALAPTLIPGEFVFCSFEHDLYGAHVELEPIASVQEPEGLTLVIPRSKADEHDIGYESVFRGITLNVHSSLDGVGLTAAFSAVLAERGISANVVAGYYHDHVFVPNDLAALAVETIRSLR